MKKLALNASLRLFVGLAGSISCSSFAFETGAWRNLDPENTLIIDSSKGRLIIEMRPELAPKAIERIKLLTREKIYDGLQFHRVIAKFVAQTGNPNNKNGGTSSHPDLPPEMVFRTSYTNIGAWATQSSDSSSGFIGTVPIQSLPLKDANKNGQAALRSWGAHCPGVAGMGRDEARDSANSELYFMLDAYRPLDRDYTVFGRVVSGMDVLLSLQHGEPPAHPDVMQTVRIMADIPESSRPAIKVPSDTAMSKMIAQTREEIGADFSVCDVRIPSKMD